MPFHYVVMEQMIGSSLKAYELSQFYSSPSEGQDPDDVNYFPPFDESEDEDDGYTSPNELSSENLHRTLHSILSEEKDKQQRIHTLTARDERSSSAAWDMPKSPMDNVFRQRVGGFDKPDLRDMQVAFDDEDSEDEDESDDDDEDSCIADYRSGSDNHPAWNLPKSPMDDVFRKRIGGYIFPFSHGFIYCHL